MSSKPRNRNDRAPGADRGRQKPKAPPAPPPLDSAFIISLCNALWPIQRRISELHSFETTEDGASSAEAENNKYLRRRFEEVKEVLKDVEVEMRDYTLASFDPGMKLQVLTYAEDSRVEPGREIVLETISPTVLRQGRVIASGSVIVGTPPNAQGGRAPANHDPEPGDLSANFIDIIARMSQKKPK
jgi:hypothetical protein